MSLKILENDGVYFLIGKVNTTTLPFIKEFINSVFRKDGSLQINVDQIIEIDFEGLNYFQSLIDKFHKGEINFLLIKGYREICNYFKPNNVA